MEEEEDPELAPPQRDIKITTSDTTGIAENHMQTSRTVLSHKAVEKDAYEVWQREQTMHSGPGPPGGHVKGEGTSRLKGPPWRVRDVSHILGASALGFSAKM